MFLLIDDVREGGYADITARNAVAGKAILEELSGCINELGIDHDLGGEVSGCDIVEWALARGYLPNKVQVVSLNPQEVQEKIVGQKLIDFEVLESRGTFEEDAYCADKEILMNFSNGKEMRIYIDEEGNLCVYSD